MTAAAEQAHSRQRGPAAQKRTWLVTGCLAGIVIAALLGVLLYPVMFGRPSRPLGLGSASGYLVFTEYPAVHSDGRLQRRTLSLDMTTGRVRQLRGDCILMSPDGGWVVLEGGECHGPDGAIVKLPGEIADRLARVRKSPGALTNDGFLLTPTAPTAPGLTILDILSGEKSAVELPRPSGARALLPGGREALITQWDRRGDRVYRVDRTGTRTPLARGWSPAVSPSGRVAYIGAGRRHIVLVGPDGDRRTIRGPGTWIDDLCWSPDERFLAYTYPVRPSNALIVGQSYWMAIAVAEVATGRSHGTVPLQFGGVSLEMVDASGFQWVARIPEWLLEDPQLP